MEHLQGCKMQSKTKNDATPRVATILYRIVAVKEQNKIRIDIIKKSTKHLYRIQRYSRKVVL